MPLLVQQVTEGDFPAMLKFIHSKDGHLSSPAADMVCPAETDDAAAVRNEWSLQQQHDIFVNDPTTTYMKAVDTDDGNSILSLARWHFYKAGYKPSALEFAGLKDRNDASSYPVGMHVPLYLGLLDAILEARGWMGDGPCWVLTTLKTRESARKRGAGGLLVEWGVNNAKRDGCPAYLEAAADAASLYRSKGFKDVEPLKVDLNPFGIPSEAVFTKMVANA